MEIKIQTIYEPKGKALEYGELALNIYTGCPHRCVYCYVPAVLRKDKETFHTCIEPRKNIVQETKKRLSKGDIKGKEIFLCFTCDPFPMGYDHEPTYEIIQAIKDSGNNVAILTKGEPYPERLALLLDNNDRFGVTIADNPQDTEHKEPGALPLKDRLRLLKWFKENTGIQTFASFEPVYDAELVYDYIVVCDFIGEYRIGKLNYAKSDINWREFGEECERLCILHGRKYMIKDGLRQEMNKYLGGANMPEPFAKGGEINMIYTNMLNLHKWYALQDDATLEQFTAAINKFIEINKTHEFACQWAVGVTDDILKGRGWK